MCGIAGFWSQTSRPELSAIARTMADTLAHRGPDDSGLWIDGQAGVALAHRRLSIIDLSPAGHQPMSSPCGRFSLVFNGEIYNHRELREALLADGGAPQWRGHSDTETLLAALVWWGMEETLRRLNGMFAFAFWDRQSRQLWLARDRMGEKPLYYGNSGNSFLFASELKALVAHPDWRQEIDRNAIALYLRHKYIPAPWSIYQGISKLLPGHFLCVTDAGRRVGAPTPYWDLRAAPLLQAEEVTATADELERRIKRAVAMRMEADVPVGAFLSGGCDSSLVVALMQAQSMRRVKTFSIGFFEQEYNEAPYARQVAEHLGTEHYEMFVDSRDALSVIPLLPSLWDEPFSDSSQIPTYLLAKLARQEVTVSLSGDGGDELFAGYDRYRTNRTLWNSIRFIPLWARRRLSRLLRRVATKERSQVSPEEHQGAWSSFADRAEKVAEVLSFAHEAALYRRTVSHWKDPGAVVLGGVEPQTPFDDHALLDGLPGMVRRMTWLDMQTYLPEDILTKVDRATMAVGLEGRIPLLDHQLVEYAWGLPDHYKIRGGEGKWILRHLLRRYLPDTLVDRRKQGFGLPIDHWLRGPLREWAEDLLSESRLRNDGYLDPRPIRSLWEASMKEAGRWHYYLWDILMFEAWLHDRKEHCRPQLSTLSA